MFWKGLFLGMFFLQRIIVPTSASAELLKISISDPEAICNDNSRAVFYINVRSTKKWIIFFEGGGFCASNGDCNKRYMNDNFTTLMTSNLLPDKVIGSDLLSGSQSENPSFFDFSRVLVPYCSSDLWLGARTNPSGKSFKFVNADPSVDNFSFRGQTIFRSVFVDLLQDYNLSEAEEIVLSGSSAGGLGVLNHAEWVLNYVRNSHGLNANILSIIDSGWFVNFQDSLESRLKSEFVNRVNISLVSCADMSYGYPCCLSSSCMLARGYFPSTVPVLFVFSLYDIYMFADVLKRLEDEGKTAEDHAADFLSVVSMYGGAMNESLVLVENQAVNMSYFVPACFQHVYFSTSSLRGADGVLQPLTEISRGTVKFSHRIESGTWTRIKIQTEAKSTSLRELTSAWVESRVSPVRLIDSCIGAHCNPTCPGKLLTFDAGAQWSHVNRTAIIILSLVMTVICFGLKSVFVLYYYYLKKRQTQNLDGGETSLARKELPPCPPNKAISIACFSLSYSVEEQKSKNSGKGDSSSHTATCRKSEESIHITEENGGRANSEIVRNAYVKKDTVNKTQFDAERGVETSSSLAEEEGFVPSLQGQQDGSFTLDNLCSGSRVAFMNENKETGMKPLHCESLPLKSQDVNCVEKGSIPVKKKINSKDIESGGKESSPLKKQILKGVSAYFNTGELVAIMGPSGCGKTTLLDLLTGRRRHGDCKGQVYLNGVGLGRLQEWYACKIGYVLQLAVPYYEELTVRQNLFFAAHLRLPKRMSISRKFERVEQIIAETGLTALADRVVGGSVGCGLSGGQKRRLCVALQMINLPSVLFLDEPTSGLDATSSLELLNHLNLVAESGRLVILTIHQPRLEIFHLFHKILLLCDGQVAYYGEPSMAPKIFVEAYINSTTEEFRLSNEAPQIDAKNPADTIMDLLNCSQARRAILDYYQTSGEPQAVQEAINIAQKERTKTVRTRDKKKTVDAGSFNRIFVLESRTSARQTIGQLIYFPLIFFVFGVVVGTVYWQAEERDEILLMSAYCVYCCASTLFLSSVLMAHLSKALDIFHLEREDGCGRSHENVIQTFVRTTAVCVIPLIVCSTMSYFMVMTNYDLWKFVFVTIISLVLNQTWIAVYMMVICAQPQIAHRICPMVSAIGGFAGGFLVPRPQMPVVYNLLFYINPQFYGYSAIAKVLLLNVRLKCEYESTLNCISTDGNAVLSRFGFDEVNPYEHLVIMLGMTVLSLLLSWLFLEAKYFKVRFLKRKTTQFVAEAEEDWKPVSEAPATDLQADTRMRRRSVLGVVRGDQGFHAFNKMSRAAAGSRKERFQSTRRRIEENKKQFDVNMYQVRMMAKLSGDHSSMIGYKRHSIPTLLNSECDPHRITRPRSMSFPFGSEELEGSDDVALKSLNSCRCMSIVPIPEVQEDEETGHHNEGFQEDCTLEGTENLSDEESEEEKLCSEENHAVQHETTDDIQFDLGERASSQLLEQGDGNLSRNGKTDDVEVESGNVRTKDHEEIISRNQETRF